MILPPLDLDAVRNFVLIAELGSFTRAAEATRTSQSTVSLKLKRLEERLGIRLVERTPRYVGLSPQGAAFIPHARALLDTHEQALSSLSEQRSRLTIGISDHVAGPELPSLIARMNAQDPHLLIEIRIGSSGDLLQRFDRRELDTVIVRRHDGRDDGVVLADERFCWIASHIWQPRAGEPLPVATMPEPCGVRVLAGKLLDEAGISWTEVFSGGGVAAVSAAVIAGLGVAALAPRMVPLGGVDIGPRLGLPDLPSLPIVLHSRGRDERSQAAVEALSRAYRAVLRT